MTCPDDRSPIQTWRTAVNSPRGNVVAIVGGLSALGGAVAGAIAALIAATVLTPTEPISAGQLAVMAIEYGVLASLGGLALGTSVAFGALRRVPLGRLLLCTNVGLGAGLVVGWLGGPWAWHHMELLGVVGFAEGALVARAFSRGSPLPKSTLSSDSAASLDAIRGEPDEAARLSAAPIDARALTARKVDRVPRRIPPGSDVD